MATKLDQIIELVCATQSVNRDEIMGRSQYRRIARARQLAMTLAREFTKLSLPQIGRKFKRDHTTILHGVRKIADLEASNYGVASQMADLRRTIRGETLVEEHSEASATPDALPSETLMRKSWKKSADLTSVPGSY